MNAMPGRNEPYGIRSEVQNFLIHQVAGLIREGGPVKLQVTRLVNPAVASGHFQQAEAEKALEGDINVFDRDTQGIRNPARIGFELADMNKFKDGVVMPSAEQLKRIQIEMNFLDIFTMIFRVRPFSAADRTGSNGFFP